MAEAIELDLTLNQPGIKTTKHQLKPILDTIQDGENSDIPKKHTIEEFYKDDQLGSDVLKNKYLAPWEKHPWQLWNRQAVAIASVEKTKALRNKWEKKFFAILKNFKFVPGGRIMHGAGREDITTTLNNCYVVAVKDDSVKSIYETIINEALTYKYGGGCGHDLSVLRPSGEAINGTGGESCGPTGFMNLFSENTNTIAQHGRRGANMQTLRIDHPDIEKFIEMKTGDIDMIKYSNISVLLTHDFMNAVKNNLDFDLKYNSKIYKTIKAKYLWKKVIENAHASAEPGILFWDTMTEYHNAEYCSPLVSTNPCAEQPLPDGGCCNLGAVNLDRFVDNQGNFLIEDFKETVATGTRFLDNVIDYNIDRHALEVQKKNAENDRRIGLGILGLGDMLVRMGIKYDSEDALHTVEQIMQIFRDTAYETSHELAKEKNPFPYFDWEGYSKSKFIKQFSKSFQNKIKKNGIRNSTLTTVAPTGSGAIVSRVTSGIEPIFATSYKRRVKQSSGNGKEFDEYTVYHPVIKKLFGNDENLPDHIVTAHNIDPFFRVKMQGIIQKYIDSSISSTVNLPNDTSVETVADIYISAYDAALKGITVYREGSREGILVTDNNKNVINDDNKKKTSDQIDIDKKPRVRPVQTKGVTRRIRTGEGTLYITINEDENGLCEVFTTIGKAGGNAAAQSEAISRLISLSLRSGLDPHSIVRQLKGISGPNPTWEDGRLILSTPDAIGKALDDYLNEKNNSKSSIVDDDEKKLLITMAGNPEMENIDTTENSLMICTKCHNHSVVNEGGCLTCRECGWSKCED
ncbi:MAG: ribonucleoside-diphosphate reductase, adenosylcobalamin-dependent [Candidatus Marinimicrobia bacterium]|nr:ribonucleoside-diphosphate reductase, adenosylcobalamin-dependent [Candidatus Neomarinimicrobiota bacterium]|tara:strand:+ start:4028 stop:6433 length:2406 start_codon:yes stop_codon:yes gene_type:complete